MKYILTPIVAFANILLAGSSLFAQVPIAKFTATNLRVNETVGFSVATDGQLVLIGTNQGAAYLFNPFTQQQLAKFISPAWRHGSSVALQGTTAVVGATYGARTFDFSNMANIIATPLIPNDAPQFFGVSVDISGDTVIIGDNADDSLGDFTGAAYLFDRATGTQYAKLNASDADAGDNFGISVAIDRDRAVVGSALAQDGNGEPRGAVYLFNTERNFAGDRQLDRYAPTYVNPSFAPQFGYASDISGEDIIALDAPGQSYMWSTNQDPIAIPNSTHLRTAGDPLSIDGSRVAVGYNLRKQVELYDLGRMRIGTAYSPDPNLSEFGFSVALGGNLLVVGAPDAPGGGAAYVYLIQDVLVPEPGSAMLLMMSFTLLFTRRQRFQPL
jgi:hypothetical protein